MSKNYSFQKNLGKVAYGALILTDRNNPGYEEICLLNEYGIGEAIENGCFDPWEVELADDEKDWRYPYKKTSIPAISLDISEVPYQIVKTRSVALCAFNAVNDYLQHWLGMKLDVHDKDWYSLNALCTSDGLPQKHTFTVIQQLLEPYGIGISHVVVPRGARRFEEYHPFLVSLGCNPFFLSDGRTTNQEALEKTFSDPKIREEMTPKMLKMWRFECRDEPLKGSISMRQFQSLSIGHNGGSNYFGPRANLGADGWHMSIKLDRLENITYHKPLTLPEYQEYEGSRVINPWAIKDDDGISLREIERKLSSKNSWNFSGTAQSNLPLPPVNTHPEPRPMFSNFAHEREELVPAYQSICETCQKYIGSHYVSHHRSCQWCGSEADIYMVNPRDLGSGYIEIPPEDLETSI